MTTIRLPNEIEEKLNDIAHFEHVTKSEIIKKALKSYLDKYYNNLSPYEAGKELFGKYGSGNSDNSKNYKSKIKDKLRDKFSN